MQKLIEAMEKNAKYHYEITPDHGYGEQLHYLSYKIEESDNVYYVVGQEGEDVYKTKQLKRAITWIETKGAAYYA